MVDLKKQSQSVRSEFSVLSAAKTKLKKQSQLSRIAYCVMRIACVFPPIRFGSGQAFCGNDKQQISVLIRVNPCLKDSNSKKTKPVC